jgi:hypothetical protein
MKSLLLAAAAAAHGAAAITWVHPGVLVSGERLADIKAMIANGTSPYPEVFAQAVKSKFAALDWQIQGPPANGIIECGSYSKPDVGCTWESNDGAAAYLQVSRERGGRAVAPGLRTASCCHSQRAAPTLRAPAALQGRRRRRRRRACGYALTASAHPRAR